MLETETLTPDFEFSGHSLCLDFTNTVHNRASEPRELLNSYADLLRWGREAGLLSAQVVDSVRARAQRFPAEAAQVLARALGIREALFRIFAGLGSGDAPAGDDLQDLNAELARALGHLSLVPGRGNFTWGWSGQEQELDCMLWPVLRSAADLLTAAEIDDVHICAADDCSWLFLDTSKNHSRRWCDMKSCGNRAKARKHYRQKKQS
jgi:predicted RNA-binding Zn ribbon-like protein